MVQATFYCHLCRRAAATLTLDAGEQQLALEGFMWQRSVERVTAEQAIQVRRVLHVRDVPGLYALNQLWAAFFCPECDQVYCLEHWRVSIAYDDDFPGWYDAAYGTCPQGHRRMIDD